MTQDTQPKLYNLSRRQVLGGLGAVGLASAGAGLGTSAFFRDDESVSAALTAGRLDLLIDYRATYNTWLDQAATDAIVNGTAIAAPGEEFNYVVGQAPDFRNEDGSMISGAAWADVTNSLDACLFEDTTDVESGLADLIGDGEYTAPASVSGLSVDGTRETDDGFVPGYVDGEDGLMFDLNDVKPKDEGEATISLHLCDNPAFIGLTASVIEASEGGVVEPEMNITNAAGEEFMDDESASELANYIYVRVWRDDDCSNTLGEEELIIYQGSLAGLVTAIAEADGDFVEGLQLPGDGDMDCFSPGVHCVAFDWYFICESEDFDLPSDAVAEGTIGDELDAAGLPRDPNVAQTDTVSFGLAFNAVQCRHNMAPAFRKVEGEGFGKDDAGADGLVSPLGAEGKIRRGPVGGTQYVLDDGNTGNGIDEQVMDAIVSGEPIPFTLAYDSSSGELTLEASGNTLVYGDDAGEDTLGNITDAVGVTVRARDDSFATVEDLRLQVPSSGIDETISGVLDARDNTGYPDTDSEPERYCAFLDVEGLSDGFTLSGTATLTIGSSSSGEQPAVYFFAGGTGAV
jgi:predicted ribosomally synthesized peptide with SipW-like signal peptide